MKASPAFLFGAGATCLVAVSIIAAAAVMGSPASFRARRLDEQRVENLRAVAQSIKGYYKLKNKLPESLADFARYLLINNGSDYGSDYNAKTRDPETGADYEYNVTGPQAYQLCATFQTLADGSTDGATYYRLGGDLVFWRHGAGRHCFDFTVKAAKPDKP